MTKCLANVTFEIEERANPVDDLTDTIQNLTELQQVRVATNGIAPERLAILLHGRCGKGQIATKQTGAHELLVWRRR